MSLLPEFNTHIYPKIFEGTCSESAGRRGLIMHAVDKLKDLLNPDLNPLTFEEVKAWFDRKVVEGKGDVIYGDTHAHESYGSIYCLYHIHEANYYHSRYISNDGFKYSLNSSEKYSFYELIEADKQHYSICELLSLTPLELFCQMKGYVNI
jgi:hypothetical protein